MQCSFDLVLSGGPTNTNPETSLGGAPSSTSIKDRLLFQDLEGNANILGRVTPVETYDYTVVYAKLTVLTPPLTSSPRAYISASSSPNLAEFDFWVGDAGETIPPQLSRFDPYFSLKVYNRPAIIPQLQANQTVPIIIRRSIPATNEGGNCTPIISVTY